MQVDYDELDRKANHGAFSTFDMEAFELFKRIDKNTSMAKIQL